MAKILIIHHRIGGTDGVSFEIAKRKQILTQMGHSVVLISGPEQSGADYVVDGLSLLNNMTDEASLYALANKTRDDFTKIFNKENPDHVFVHNVLSLGRNLAAAVALLDVLDVFKTHTICVNHDIYWERQDLLDQKSDMVKKMFEEYLVPKRLFITHTVINSLAQKVLLKKRGIASLVISDVFDFDQPRWGMDQFNSDLLQSLQVPPNALVILQATRIIQRKAVELTIDYASALQSKIDKKVVVLLPNYVEFGEQTAQSYAQRIKDKAQKMGVTLVFGEKHFGHERLNQGGQKTYSLWDAYAVADIVAYPSLLEGYGNQFLEAVFAKKLLVLFEYPVFLADIKPKGYSYVSLGKDFEINGFGLAKLPASSINEAVAETFEYFGNPELTKSAVQKNFDIAKQNNSLEVLKVHLHKVLEPETVSATPRNAALFRKPKISL